MIKKRAEVDNRTWLGSLGVELASETQPFVVSEQKAVLYDFAAFGVDTGLCGPGFL